MSQVPSVLVVAFKEDERELAYRQGLELGVHQAASGGVAEVRFYFTLLCVRMCVCSCAYGRLHMRVCVHACLCELAYRQSLELGMHQTASGGVAKVAYLFSACACAYACARV